MRSSRLSRVSRRVLVVVAVVAGMAVPLPAPAADWFVDVARELGVEFEHWDGRSGEKYYVESLASGGGWLDFDGDGDLDLYLIDGAATPGSPAHPPTSNRLYENRNGRFVDVTAHAGVGDTGYGMGLCVGDIDADSRLDFLVTNYGADRLYRNLGGGKFAEVANAAGLTDRRWSGSCAFGDLDGDGDLDLYVTRYLDFSYANNPFCGQGGRRHYCRPAAFNGLVDSLYINQGDGTFIEEGRERGLAQTATEKGLGVLLTDGDDDGDLDIYVTNDGTANRLYVNSGQGRFEDAGLLSGVALSGIGNPEASMGIDAGDIDGDGRMDLMVTHFSRETNTFYSQAGSLLYDDATRRLGLGRVSYDFVGWGLQFIDFDNDADLDLAIANGHVQEGIESMEPDLSYAQPNQLFENPGSGAFREVSAEAGAAWRVERVSRALAAGDFDNDGRIDLLVTNTNGRPALLANRVANGNHWLGVELVGPAANPFAIGARVALVADDRRQLREVRSGGSFQAQPDLRLHFGLGEYAGEVALHIRWPDGRLQTARTAELDRYWRLDYRPD